jgi:hypothetical protein
MCDSNLSYNSGCNCLPGPIFWGCPAPLAEADFSIKNPPYLRPVLPGNPPFQPRSDRVQTWAQRQPVRGPTLAPWNGQPIPPRPVAYSPVADW